MTTTDLDESYSLLCQTMTRLGRSETERFLARFAVMALALLPDRGIADRVIAAAADIDRAEAPDLPASAASGLRNNGSQP